jgi:hypothetical protein
VKPSFKYQLAACAAGVLLFLQTFGLAHFPDNAELVAVTWLICTAASSILREMGR